MKTSPDEEQFFQDLLTNLNPDELLDQIFIQPLKDLKISLNPSFLSEYQSLLKSFKMLQSQKNSLIIQSKNPIHTNENLTVPQNLTPVITSSNGSSNLPIALNSSRSSPVFSALSSYTNFVRNINQQYQISPPSVILNETQVQSVKTPNVLPKFTVQNPLLDFSNYTIPQLKLACQQFNIIFKTADQAVKALEVNYQKTKKIPQIQLSAYQIMTPQRKNNLEFRIQKGIFESKFYISIISFVPFDIRKLHGELKKNGISVSLGFFTEYLRYQGVVFCEGDREIGEIQEVKQQGVKQLTLSENLTRRKNK